MIPEDRLCKRINVVVCDSCPLIFSGLQKSCEGDTRIRIADESSTLRSLRQKIAGGEFDIALVEWCMIRWHDHECLKLAREITEHTSLVLLGMHESTRDRKRALEFGARGIVSKRSTAGQVRKALCRVAEGAIWLEKSAAETLLDHVFSPSTEPRDEIQRIELLTRREREVIGLVCRSLRNKEIASELGISESTVWHHLTSIFSKLRIADRVSLVTFAFRHGLDSFAQKPSIGRERWPATTGSGSGRFSGKTRDYLPSSAIPEIPA